MRKITQNQCNQYQFNKIKIIKKKGLKIGIEIRERKKRQRSDLNQTKKIAMSDIQ